MLPNDDYAQLKYIFMNWYQYLELSAWVWKDMFEKSHYRWAWTNKTCNQFLQQQTLTLNIN